MVVAVGQTEMESFEFTMPICGSITHDSAPVEDHVRVADSPAVIDDGLADRLTVGVGELTVSVALDVALPPGPLATSVYVVVVSLVSVDPETVVLSSLLGPTTERCFLEKFVQR
jgi:hypothetical protein